MIFHTLEGSISYHECHYILWLLILSMVWGMSQSDMDFLLDKVFVEILRVGMGSVGIGVSRNIGISNYVDIVGLNF